MRFRRFATAALIAAVALVPFNGHALLEEKRTVPGSLCTVGSEQLTFDGSVGLWIGTAELDCVRAGEPVPQIGMTINFVLTQVQGVNSFKEPYLTGPSTMPSQSDPTNPAATTFSCANCASLQAQGSKASLVPGLYIMYTQSTVQQATTTRRGTHTTCFLVTGDVEGPAQAIPGCTP